MLGENTIGLPADHIDMYLGTLSKLTRALAALEDTVAN